MTTVEKNGDITTSAKGAEVKTYVTQVHVDSKFTNDWVSRNKVLGAGRNTICKKNTNENNTFRKKIDDKGKLRGKISWQEKNFQSLFESAYSTIYI